MDSSALGLPSQSDTAAWAHMLAVARGADEMRLDGKREIYPHPLTKARLKTLLPIARKLYYEKVFGKAETESRNIDEILRRCGWQVSTTRKTAESWSAKVCWEKSRELLVPHSLNTMQPTLPNAIGFHMIPTHSTWSILRLEITKSMSDAEMLQKHRYACHFYYRIRRNRRDWNALQPICNLLDHDEMQRLRDHFDRRKLEPLNNVLFADEVRSCAPPLVRGLPPQWTSPDLSDQLLEALQALLGLGNTRHLTKLVELLSNAEYDYLVKERSCLSQALGQDDRVPSCENLRSLDDYTKFAHILQQDADFKGSLADIPCRSPFPASNVCGPPIATGSKHKTPSHKWKQIGVVATEQRWYTPPYPPQTNAVAWARMLAAARGADKIQTSGARELGANPLTKARLDALLPIAREIYDLKVRPTVQRELVRIVTLCGHCNGLVAPVRLLDKDLIKIYKRGAEELWDVKSCEKAAQKLLVPLTLRTLRPMSPNAMGINMIPNFSAWRPLRAAMLPSILRSDKRQQRLYKNVIDRNMETGAMNSSVADQLRNVRFVDAVLKRAPPLVGALPLRWTSPDITDNLLEAFLGLLNLGNTRPLANLVNELSKAEYDRLVKERSFLLSVLDKVDWTCDCADGCRLDDYHELVRILRQDAAFKGSLETVPPQSTASRKKAKYSSSGDLGPLADDSYPFGTSLLTKRPAMVHDGSIRGEAVKRPQWEPLRGWAVKRQRSVAIHRNVAMRQQSDDSHRGIGTFTAQRPAAVVNQLLGAEGQALSATDVSSASVSLLAAAGAVAALGLVLLLAVVAFRLRSRRIARGRSQAPAEQL